MKISVYVFLTLTPVYISEMITNVAAQYNDSINNNGTLSNDDNPQNKIFSYILLSLASTIGTLITLLTILLLAFSYRNKRANRANQEENILNDDIPFLTSSTEELPSPPSYTENPPPPPYTQYEAVVLTSPTEYLPPSYEQSEAESSSPVGELHFGSPNENTTIQQYMNSQLQVNA